MNNKMKLEFSSVSKNEGFARVAIGAFVAQLNPSMEELTEIKTVVSEAVTNAIIHGYNNEENHTITLTCQISGEEMELTVEDQGIGIEDLEQAREPLYTSKPELERSGMGFTIMENFMDAVEITSTIGEGTCIRMKKQLISNKTVCK